MKSAPAIALAAVALAALAMCACAVPRQMLASPDDLRDYRAFRVAAREGSRLACAQQYLRRHPDGAWRAEVQAAFDAEEPAFFADAQTSRWKAREYLVDLPQGPHAEASRELLLLFDAPQDDIDTLMLLTSARRTAAVLDYETDRRKRLTDLLLAELAALLDRATVGARVDRPPPLLAAILRGEATPTSGGKKRPPRVDEVFFVIPTPDGSQPREADVELVLVTQRGRVVGGRIQGDDLFVRWAEALLVRVLDPTDPADRGRAAAAVGDVLRGALEASLPEARCRAADEAVVSRACDGWSVKVTMGPHGGTADVIDVRGPS